MVVVVGDAGVSIVGEVDDPALLAVVGRDACEVTVGEFLQIRQHLCEVRIQGMNHLALAEIAGTDQVFRTLPQDQGRKATERRVEIEHRVTVDLGFLAGGQVDPDKAGPVGAPVGTEPHAGAIGGDLEWIDAQRVVGTVEHHDGAQRARLPVPLRQFDVAVRCQRGSEQLTVVARYPARDVPGVQGEQGELAAGDVDLVHVEQLWLPVVELDDHLARQSGW